METATRGASVVRGAAPSHPWTRHGCDWAARLATAAASLCPALSSVAGAVVGALIALMACAAPGGQHGRGTAPAAQRGAEEEP